ncbi:MAG: Rpn family recombination-promoting nuclease/putative transposase, partial [Acidobacteriota bacterium]
MPVEKSTPNPHDAFFRHMLARPGRAEEFLRWYMPSKVGAFLDLSTLTQEDTSFVDLDLRTHFSDLLFRVRLIEGGDAFVLILLEHKSSPDPRVALQLLRYGALTWDRMPLPLPMLIPVVVYHGKEKWKVGKKFSSLFGLVDKVWRRYLPDFEYHLCDLSKYRDDQLHGEGGLAAILKLLKYIFLPELEAKLPDVFLETTRQIPESQASEEIKTMAFYLESSGRASTEVIMNAFSKARRKGGEMGTIMERIVEEYGPMVYKKAEERGKQQATIDLTLEQMNHKFGELEASVAEKIRGLAIGDLKNLAVDLLDF